MNEPIINPNVTGVSTQSTSTLKDLVFNPETGDFERVSAGTTYDDDIIKKTIDVF